MDEKEKKIRAAVRDEGRREAIKSGCLMQIVEMAIGAACGCYSGYQVSPTAQGALIGAAVGAVLASGLWILL